jgi:hypothetical protein
MISPIITTRSSEASGLSHWQYSSMLVALHPLAGEPYRFGAPTDHDCVVYTLPISSVERPKIFTPRFTLTGHCQGMVFSLKYTQTAAG